MAKEEWYVDYAFKDLEDDNHIYELNAPYPREGYEPTKARIEQLSGKNSRKREYIKKRSNGAQEPKFKGVTQAFEDLTVAELREVAKERGIEGYSQLKKQELQDKLKA